MAFCVLLYGRCSLFVVRCIFVVGCGLVGCWLCDWWSLVVVLRLIVYCLLFVGRWLRVSCCRSLSPFFVCVCVVVLSSWWLFVVCCLVFVGSCVLFVVCCF